MDMKNYKNRSLSGYEFRLKNINKTMLLQI